MTMNEMKYDRFAIVSFGKKKENFLKAIEFKTIGSPHTTFEKHIKPNQIVFFHFDGAIWGAGKVSTNYFYDNRKIWEDKAYPHRFGIEVLCLTKNSIPTSHSDFAEEMRNQFGYGWGFSYIFAPQPLPTEIGRKIFKEISASKSATIADLHHT